MTTTLYAVTGSNAPGDRGGALIDGETGAFIQGHMSSSKTWLLLDLTRNFGRDEELKARYPSGFTVVELTSWDEAPAEVQQRNAEWAESTSAASEATA